MHGRKRNVFYSAERLGNLEWGLGYREVESPQGSGWACGSQEQLLGAAVSGRF